MSPAEVDRWVAASPATTKPGEDRRAVASPSRATRGDDRLDLRLLVPALAGWGLDVGLLWAGVSPSTVVIVAGGCAAVAAMSVLAHRNRRSWRSTGIWRGWRVLSSTVLGLSLAVGALVAGCLAGHGIIRSVGTIDRLAEEHAIVEVEATIEGDPRPVRLVPGRRVDTARVVIPVRVRSIVGRGQRSQIDAPMLVIGDARWQQVRWQQTVVTRGRLVPTEPGDDVVAVLRPLGEPALTSEAPALFVAAAIVRERFRAATSQLPADAGGLVPALVLGDTSATPPDLTAAMNAAGLSHLSAVSGSNVAIVLAGALWLARIAGVRRRWRPVAALLLLAAFVIVVRPEPSVLRAAVMGVVGLLGLGTARRAVAAPALSTAIVALLCWDPWLARSYGFALSVLATLGLLLFARGWGRAIGRRLPPRLAGLGPAVAVPLAAQATCAPVIVLLEGTVSIVAVPANLAAAVFVAPATVAGVIVAGVAVCWLPAARVLAWAAGLPAWAIAVVARVAAEQPWGSVPWPGGPGGAALLAVVVALIVAVGPAAGRWAQRHRAAVVALGAGVAMLVAAAAYPVREVGWPLVGWRLVACSVGQGDALVLATGPGHAVLVDAGPDPPALATCLDRLGVRTVDALILTHFHADHVQGLPGALRGRVVREVLTTPVQEPDDQVEQVLAWSAAVGVPVSPLYAGDELVWPGIHARVWWPARVIHEGSVPNNASIVITATLSTPDSADAAADAHGPLAGAGDGPAGGNRAGEHQDVLRVALLGDIEREASRSVLGAMQRAGMAGLPVDVVKVAHHGSANREDSLLDALPAPLAIICVGAGNDYGHPAPSTLIALQRRGFRVLRTDLAGDIGVTAVEDRLMVATRGP